MDTQTYINVARCLLLPKRDSVARRNGDTPGPCGAGVSPGQESLPVHTKRRYPAGADLRLLAGLFALFTLWPRPLSWAVGAVPGACKRLPAAQQPPQGANARASRRTDHDADRVVTSAIGAAPAQSPLHPANIDPAAGEAVSAITVSTGYGSLQSPGQSIPARSDVTVPDPDGRRFVLKSPTQVEAQPR